MKIKPQFKLNMCIKYFFITESLIKKENHPEGWLTKIAENT